MCSPGGQEVERVRFGEGGLEALRKKRMEQLVKQAEEQKQRMAWPDRPITLTDSSFKGAVAMYPLILVDFWAPWCGPCKMVGPVIEQLAAEYKGRVVFGKLNVEENPAMASSFNVVSIPTMLLVKDRELVERITGAVPKSTLVSILEKHMGA